MLNVWKWWKCVVVLHEKYLLTTTRHADKNVINCGSYLPKSNKSIVDIRVLPDAASCLPRYVQTWRHLQSRKKVTCCIVVRGGTTHGHRQQAQKIFWSLDPWFLRYASGQTDSSYYTVIPKNDTLQFPQYVDPIVFLTCRIVKTVDVSDSLFVYSTWKCHRTALLNVDVFRLIKAAEFAAAAGAQENTVKEKSVIIQMSVVSTIHGRVRSFARFLFIFRFICISSHLSLSPPVHFHHFPSFDSIHFPAYLSPLSTCFLHRKELVGMVRRCLRVLHCESKKQHTILLLSLTLPNFNLFSKILSLLDSVVTL